MAATPDPSKFKKIDLKPAFLWACEKCQKLHYSTPCPLNMSDAKREEVFRKINALDDWMPLDEEEFGKFEVKALPILVRCIQCGSLWRTMDINDDDDDDDDDPFGLGDLRYVD